MFDWIGQKITNAILSFFIKVTTDFFNGAFKLITDAIISTNDVNKYFNTMQYVGYVQILALSLMTLAVVWEAFKQTSGGMIATEEKSIGTFILQIVWAVLMVFALPLTVTKILLPINDILSKAIQKIGFTVQIDSFTKIEGMFGLSDDLNTLSFLIIFALLILSVAFVALGIAGGIRYAELIFALIIAPIAACSLVRNGEALQVWVREIIAIVFTQTIQILGLQIILNVIAHVTGIMMVVLSIGVIIVTLRGPKMLRTFLYSSGVSSASVGAVGSAGRMAAMKYMFTSAAGV